MKETFDIRNFISKDIIELRVLDKEKGLFEYSDYGIDIVDKKFIPMIRQEIEKYIEQELLKDFEIIENKSKVIPNIYCEGYEFLPYYIVKRKE